VLCDACPTVVYATTIATMQSTPRVITNQGRSLRLDTGSFNQWLPAKKAPRLTHMRDAVTPSIPAPTTSPVKKPLDKCMSALRARCIACVRLALARHAARVPY